MNEIVKLNSEIAKFAEIKQSDQEVQATVKVRTKDVQATPQVRTITSNTGYDLLTAFMGEKGNLIIKQSEL